MRPFPPPPQRDDPPRPAQLLDYRSAQPPRKSKALGIFALVVTLVVIGTSLLEVAMSLFGISSLAASVVPMIIAAILVIYSLLSPLSARPVKAWQGIILLTLSTALHMGAAVTSFRRATELQQRGAIDFDPSGIRADAKEQGRAEMIASITTVAATSGATLILYVVLNRKRFENGSRLIEM